MDIKLKQNHVNINMKATGGIGTKDHSKLTNLDFENSGHTGFASAVQIQELLEKINKKQNTLTAGDNISIIDDIISVTGLDKSEIYIGPDEPTDPNIKIWIDTNEVAQEFYTKQEIDAKNFATETWVSAQGYLTQHQDLSEYAKKSEIPTKVSAFENDAGYLTQHQDLSDYALKTEIPTVPTNVSAFENDAGYLTEHQSLADYALKTELPTEYVKSATVQGNKLTLTNKDNTTVDFEPSGGSGGGGTNYTFTDGLTETDGVVKWDLNDRIKAGEGTDSVKMPSTSKYTKATGIRSLSLGWNTFATGTNSVAIGYFATSSYKPDEHMGTDTGIIANGIGSFAGGKSSTEASFSKIAAEGEGSIAFGFLANPNNVTGSITALGNGAIAHGWGGYDITAMGNGSHAEGCGNVAQGFCAHAEGAYSINDSSVPAGNRGAYAHKVGNGTNFNNRSNAYTLDWQGNGTFAGTVSSSTGADYAEYFEWKDGNPNNEDRVGYIVTLDGDKIVKANTGDDVLGICSGTAMVLGDSAEWNWSKRYLTDDFGRIIYEDYDVEHEEIKDEETGKVIEEAWTEHIHAPKINPEYDASQPYIKSADRPEWQIVGMMGKIYVRDDGSCIVNGYADVKDGIATKANGKTNMRVMERVTDNIVRVLMK